MRHTAKKFSAILERLRNQLNWVVIWIPFDVARVWGKRGQLRVKGDIQGFEFATSIFPDGHGRHFMIVNRQMQRHAKVRSGMVAGFRLEPDLQNRPVQVSGELEAAFRQSRRLQKFYQSLNPSTRREIVRFIESGKSADTRARRAEQTAERLMETMEAERALPPMLVRAFAQNPEAAAGWDRMSASHRRAHLFGIFHYRDPEARMRRIDKAIGEMLVYAEKRRSRDG